MAADPHSPGNPGHQWRLSKSKVVSFQQCPKRLWLQVHRPQEATADCDAQARFAAGHEVGAAACSSFGDGVLVDDHLDLDSALLRTASLLSERPARPLFEAAFERDGVVVKVDILEPDQGRWRLAEVKSSTSVKDYHLSDVAVQVWTLQGANVPLSDIFVRHLNRDFVLLNQGDYAGLFVDAPVQELIEPLVESQAQVVGEARQVLCGSEPEQSMGNHCTAPFDCEFQAYCSRSIVKPQWPIALLPNTGRKLAEHWAERDVFELLDLPPESLTNPLHVRIYEATRTGQPFHDCKAAIATTRAWAFPRTWLDFETIAFAVPRWIGTRPWEQVPFQFSAHIERDTGAISHHEFLSLSGDDPRQSLAAALVAAVPSSGAIIAYNASFERGCLERLAAACPQFTTKLRDMACRIVDLLPVARSCWYHPDQKGSWSIKAVLPTVSERLGYAEMEIAHGAAAQLAYLEAIGSDNPERRLELDRSLRDYCKRDTEAMIELYRRLVTSAQSSGC